MSTKFEAAVIASWARFEVRLGAAIETRRDGSIEIQMTAPGGSEEERSVEICLLPTEVWAFVYDAPEASGAALSALGWVPESSRDWEIAQWAAKLPLDQVDVLVSMVTGALRLGYDVPDPSFLVDNMDALGADRAPDDETESVAEITTSVELVEPAVTTPTSIEELQALVDQTMGAHLGNEVHHDSDGDIPFTNGIVPVWVQVHPTEPRVRVFSHVTRRVERTRQARIEMDVLNRRTTDISFYLDHDLVVAEAYVDALPFVPQHLTRLVDHVLTTLDDLALDLALRVGGRTFFDGVGSTPGESPDSSADR